jgi:large subunit ribosomal protein L18
MIHHAPGRNELRPYAAQETARCLRVSVERDRRAARSKRHLRVRRKVTGTAARPRLCVYKSTRHIYAQLIDDVAGKTVAAASTREKALAEGLSSTKDTAAAVVVGKAVAERAVQAGLKEVVFDRAGWPYHGRVKALAEAAREAGLVM